MWFVDFKKAFDSISHDKLWVTMMDTRGLGEQHQYLDLDSPWKSQSECQRTEMNIEITSTMWPDTSLLITCCRNNDSVWHHFRYITMFTVYVIGCEF